MSEFAASGASEHRVEITPCAKDRRDCLRNGLDASPIRVRLIRIELPNGEVEVMTSLGNAIPGCEFAALYHLRWGIEIDQSCCLRKSVFHGLALLRECFGQVRGAVRNALSRSNSAAFA